MADLETVHATIDHTGITGVGGSEAGALVLIEQIVRATDGAISFSSIPGTYKHLLLLASLRSDRTGSNGDGILMRVGNSSVDSGNNYRWRFVAVGATVPSANGTAQSSVSMHRAPSASDTAGEFGSLEVKILDYARSVRKTVVFAGGDADDFASGVGGWSGTSVIDIISLIPANGSNWVTGSQASLYGIG